MASEWQQAQWRNQKRRQRAKKAAVKAKAETPAEPLLGWDRVLESGKSWPKGSAVRLSLKRRPISVYSPLEGKKPKGEGEQS